MPADCGHPQQAHREPDRQLVEADAEPEHHQAQAACRTQPFGVVVIPAQHPESSPRQHRDRDVLRRAGQQLRQGQSEQQPHQRHAALESGEDRAQAQALGPSRPLDPDRGRDGEGVQAQRQHQGRHLYQR